VRVVQLLPELNEGGVERGTVELSKELVKKGIDSVVISNGGKLVKDVIADGATHIKLDICSKNPFTFIYRVFKLRKVLKETRPDILHIRSRLPAWLIFFANKNLNIPTVSTVHGFNSVNFYSKIMTKADRVICVSGAIKDFIKKHYAVKEKKITVVPRGVDLKIFNPNNVDTKFINEFIEKHSLKDKFVVSTVGRITQLKDLESFIKAVSILQSKKSNIKALVVGGVREDKKEYFKSLKILIDSLGVDVEFVGSISKVAEIYFLSDVVVSSSKKPESFGRSVAEALALNTPVVASAHGGVLDIIKEKENGYFFEVGNSEDLAQKILLADELKFDGFEYIRQNFSLEQMVEKTIEVYRDLLRYR
jgi:glycosyltransferase involved in cell wall biosynthesis